MSKTIIPKGYRISVTTWENDGDNYKTEILEGVKESHIPFIVEVCNLLRSQNATPPGFGNLYDESPDGLIEALDDLIQKYPDRPEYCDSGQAVYENLLWDLGFTASEDYTTRVFDKIKIEYVPEQIVLEDVTNIWSK